MRAVSLDDVKDTMRLGRTLYAGDGRILLQRGTLFSAEYVEHLRMMGFSHMYVEDASAGATPEPQGPVSDRTRAEAAGAVKEAFGHFRVERGQKVQQDWVGRRVLYQAANSILSEIQACRDLTFQMMEMRASDDYTFAHSVNVCVLGMAMARQLRMPHGKLIDLAIGLLLHDVGKQLLPEGLRDVQRELTPDEQKAYEAHAQGGFGLLQTMGSSFAAHTKIIALQHHENWDGSGYPKGLKEIHDFAQICAIANTYDRLTTSAAYGRVALPHEALEYLMGSGGRLFSLPMVQAFLEIVAPYPMGTMVQLNNGDIGVVWRIEKGLPARPVLRMWKGGRVSDEDFKLSARPDLVVVRTVELREMETAQA